MAHGYDQYAGVDEAAALGLLAQAEHGQLSIWDGEARQPSLTFMHFVPRLEGPAGARAQGGEIWGHLANTNPMLRRLDSDPRATFTVFGPAAYVPSYFSGEPRGVPTSYYSWGQFAVEAELVRDPTGLIAILETMLARFQPEGRHPPLDPADRYWQGLLGAITGLRLRIVGAQSRFKYGQNKSAGTRLLIVDALRQRGLAQDGGVVERVLAHLPADDRDAPPAA